MANEVTTSSQSAQMVDLNGDTIRLPTTPRQQFDLTNAVLVGDTQEIGTTAEAIDIGSLTTPAFVRFKNLDSTNFITHGPFNVSYYEYGEVSAGEWSNWIKIQSGVTIYAKADTAACKVFIEVIGT